MKTVAVTGYTGFTGGALARRLAAEGFHVRALARSAQTSEAGIEVVTGVLGDSEALDRLVAGADTVFHVAAMYRNEGEFDEFFRVNVEGTRALMEASIRAGVRRFVYCSTIGVHGDVAQSPASEDAPFNPRDPYQETKLIAEKEVIAVHDSGRLETVVIRPCAIYGPGDTRMLKMFRMLSRGFFVFVGRFKPNFHPVYIDDLVQAFILAMTTQAAAGKAFIIGGPEYMPLREYVRTAAQALGASPVMITVPYRLMTFAAVACEKLFPRLGLQPPLHRRRLSFFKHNRAFSIEKARDVLGYRPVVSLAEGFRRTVAWYRAQGLLK